MIVIDASALIEVLLGRAEALSAVEAEFVAREHEPLHAPEVIEPETLNALRRLARRGAITDRRASEAVADFGSTRLLRYPHAPLRERVWAYRQALTSYDATYLALAEALEEPVLVTGNAGLAATARGSLGEERVRLL